MSENALLADCHTHIDDYPANEMPDILQRAQDAGVRFIVVAGTTMESTRKCIDLSSQYDMLYAGVGIHPMNARETIDEETYTDLKSMAGGPRQGGLHQRGWVGLPARFSRSWDSVPSVPRTDTLGPGVEIAHHLPLPGVAPRGVPDLAGRAGRGCGRGDALFPSRRSHGQGGH